MEPARASIAQRVRVVLGDGNHIAPSCPYGGRFALGYDINPFARYNAAMAALTGAYGVVAVLESGEVQAFLGFRPKGCIPGTSPFQDFSPVCPFRPKELALWEQVLPEISNGRRDTLCITCTSIYPGEPRLRRKGIASAMVRYTLKWAARHSYKRVEALGRYGDWETSPYPHPSFWTRLGFDIIEDHPEEGAFLRAML